MWRTLQPVIDSLFVGPVWPASVLLLLVFVYVGLSLITSFDLGGTGGDGVEIDWDAHGWQSLGAASWRWFHLDSIPIVVWFGIFAAFHWLLAYILWHSFDSSRHEPTFLVTVLLTVRNGTIAALLTRSVTAPLVPYLAKRYGYEDESLIGSTAVVSSGQATSTYGQAKFNTGGAPLLLNIRTTGDSIAKGSAVRIVSYEPVKRVYIVTPEADFPATVSPDEASVR